MENNKTRIQSQNKYDLTRGTVWKVILRFAFPLLIANLLLQFNQIVDSIIVGRVLGKEALAAVSASFFIYYFIILRGTSVQNGIFIMKVQ